MNNNFNPNVVILNERGQCLTAMSLDIVNPEDKGDRVGLRTHEAVSTKIVIWSEM